MGPIPVAYYRGKLQDFAGRCRDWRSCPDSLTKATQERIFAPILGRSNLHFATLRARIEEEAKFWRLCVAQLVGAELLLEVTVRS